MRHANEALAGASNVASRSGCPSPTGASGQTGRFGQTRACEGEALHEPVEAWPCDDAVATPGERLLGAGGDQAEQEKLDQETRRRTFVRMTLIEDYRLSSAFIQVPKLALILGMSPSTIWSHMRQRKFPIPYRVLNTTPMVCIDDLVDWYCAKDDLILPDTASEPRRSAAQEAEDERRRRDVETDDIVASALASLGIEPKMRKRRL